MSNNKSPGEDNIVAELLKNSGRCGVLWLHRIFCSVWTHMSIPKDWKSAILLPLFKNKGSSELCENYRGIVLLSVPGKVLSRVILNRLKPWSEVVLHEMQCGFREERSCCDDIFSVRQVVEKSIEKQRPLFMCFIDLKKAYDSVDRNALWKILQSTGIPLTLLNIIQQLHRETTCKIKACDQFSSEFYIHTGVKQGCILAPLLFCIFLDHVVREAFKNSPGIEIGFKFGHKLINPRTRSESVDVLHCLLYADDMVVFCDDPLKLKLSIEKLEDITQQWAMVISVPKTKILVVNVACDTPDPIIILRGEQIEVVKTFTYLGSIVSSNGRVKDDVDSRINKASSAFNKLRKYLWNRREISLNTKMRIFNAVILSVLLYGGETWTLLKKDLDRLETFQMRCLRCILHISRRDHQKNEDVRSRCCQQPLIECCLRQRRLRWFGHVCRMENIRIPKRLLFGQLLKGKRPHHKPRKRWTDVITEDFRKLKIQHTWPTLTQDRAAWRGIVHRSGKEEVATSSSKNITRSLATSSYTTSTLASTVTPSRSVAGLSLNTAPVVSYLQSDVWVKFKVGRRHSWYHGIVQSYDPSSNKYHISFDDGDSEELTLPTQDPDVRFSPPTLRSRSA